MTLKKKCFISHCTDDHDVMDRLGAFLAGVFGYDMTKKDKKSRFFCTYASGVTPGMTLSNTLNAELKSCDVMIAVVTDSYLRSPIAVCELCSFAAAGKYVIPLVFNGQNGISFLQNVLPDKIFIDVCAVGDPVKLAATFAEALKNAFSQTMPPQTLSCAEQFFRGAAQNAPTRPFIGCSDALHSGIILPAEQFGISGIRGDQNKQYHDRLLGCSELWILSTTGRTLIGKLSEDILPRILAEGGTVTVAIANKESPFCRDVAEIENPADWQQNLRRLDGEFNDVLQYLRESIAKAKRKSDAVGCVRLVCTHTLLRQTVVVGRRGNALVGWLSTTVPPIRTISGTPTFDFACDCAPDAGGDTLGEVCYRHVRAICAFSERKGTVVTVTEDTRLPDGFFPERATARAYWEERYRSAKDNMDAHRGEERLLVEVAAQHPLKSGTLPGTEFEARLNRALEIYRHETALGHKVTVYVPGSLHRYNGVPDAVSLSRAGTDYLSQNGIPAGDLLGDDANLRYKGGDGVYNSADECYVTSRIFSEGGFGRLLCVCSPNQLIRKKLFYIEFGVLADFVTVSCARMFHSEIDELFESVPQVLYGDHSQQDPHSAEWIRCRRERMPGFAPEVTEEK